jgi:hypothetical protein
MHFFFISERKTLPVLNANAVPRFIAVTFFLQNEHRWLKM